MIVKYIMIFGCLLMVSLRSQALADDLFVPVNRSVLVTLKDDAEEVQVASPEIADIHAHNPKNITIIGKKIGQTTVRIFSASGGMLRDIGVTVGYDLPAIRKALKEFLPNEAIAVDRVGSKIALTGQVSGAGVIDSAVQIVQGFIATDRSIASTGTNTATMPPEIMNMMQVISGQQVMLRVQIGEIRREALKILGMNLNAISRAAGTGMIGLGTGAGITGLTAGSEGAFTFSGSPPTDTQGILIGRWQPDGTSGNTIAGAIRALERDGLFKLLAEPNLVAVSGEEAEFLAGGEIPVPVVSGSSSNSVSIEYKPFGVALRFTPQVLSENRMRLVVLPEVSEISSENAVTISGFSIPSISTRRAKTTVELAPGESFMIAGLIKDQTSATVEQLPGVKEVPVLGALFRSTEFQRNETELVIAVTPYIVDPLKGSDVKLPTDDFRPSSQMEMFFYGALGSLSGGVPALSQTPPVEGPIGFMVD